MSYLTNGKNLTNIFNSENSSVTAASTGFVINDKDLAQIYTPLGTNFQLQSSSTNIIATNGNDLNELFELNFIDYSASKASFTTTPVNSGCIITVTSNGIISFNYSIDNMDIYMIGGGGAGGEFSANNAGGGGGGGGYGGGTVSINNVISVDCEIGTGGVSDSTPTGGTTSITLYDTNKNYYMASVYGGGVGGNGKSNGSGGGCGGGGGGWSNTQTHPGDATGYSTSQPSAFKNLTFLGNSGGTADKNDNDNGGAGGGGGCASVGSSSNSGGSGGDGITLKWSNSSTGTTTYAYFSGGGGGGGSYENDGGAGGNGAGVGGSGSEDMNLQKGYNAATRPYYGGGGGGGGNSGSGSEGAVAGGSGAAGVIILYITQSMINGV